VKNWDRGIGKITRGLCLLPKDHYVSQAKLKSLPEEWRRIQTISGHNPTVTEMCPMYLLGHNIDPHQLMQKLAYGKDLSFEDMNSAYLCNQCGICELVSCDVEGVSPRKVYGSLKKEMEKKKVKNLHKRTDFRPRSNYEFSKISLSYLMERTDLKKYYQRSLPHIGKVNTRLVRIPISLKGNSQVTPSVFEGQKVNRGDVVAYAPVEKIGSVQHASIKGTVSEITNDWIEISGGLDHE
jgi:Na+-translocating ferredoxin:NAD+ oxidoreductase RnfC subunit